jgi:predicted GIY-YIG superfamily endonuclease
MASTNRNTYKYHMKVGNKIVHRGITNDLERREIEHQQKHPDAHIMKVGNKTTRPGALKWERKGGKKT